MQPPDPAQDAITHLNPRTLSSEDVAKRLKNNVHVDAALGALLKKPAITSDDVIRLIYAAVKEKVLTEDEGAKIYDSLPKEPRLLRGVLAHLHQVVKHAGILLRSEIHHRGIN